MPRDKRTGEVTFDPPLNARYASIDGRSCVDCEVIRISEIGAELRLSERVAHFTPFLLIFKPPPAPVLRRCKLAWGKGKRIRVLFEGERASFHRHMEADN